MKENKIIAEFMGTEHTKKVRREISKENFNGYKYHKDWDWLMPVVDKIEGIDEELEVFGGNFIKVSYSVQIENKSVTIWKHSDRFDSKRIIEVNGESKRSTTYNAVVEFINEYNQYK